MSQFDKISEQYQFTGPQISLGSVVIDGQVSPAHTVGVPLAMMNRHGLIAGATGTGKTKTVQLITEQLSDAGVPVVMADVKGDLSGLSRIGVDSGPVCERAAETADAWSPSSYPVEFLSLGSDSLVPVRATVDGFGPVLMSKVLALSPTQESNLAMVFYYARKQHRALDTLDDLRGMLLFLASAEGKPELDRIGALSGASVGVILRSLIGLQSEGGDSFFGALPFRISDLMRTDADGRGVVSLIELSGQQAARPVVFSTFLMWVLGELFDKLPEVGDIDRPKLVFVLDEAHLLFHDSSKAFVDKVEQTVKLIRSKGVGVFFCTQLPTDVPDGILSQLGARVQHAVRAFTPKDQAGLVQAARTYPVSDVYNIEKLLTSMGIGEAVVTVLSDTGVPTPVAWTRLRAPRSFMGAVDAADMAAAASSSGLRARYVPEPAPVSEPAQSVELPAPAEERVPTFRELYEQVRRSQCGVKV